MKKLIFLIVIVGVFILSPTTTKSQTITKDSLTSSISYKIVNNNAQYEYFSIKFKSSGSTDSIKVYHSFDNTNWNIATLRTCNFFGTDDTLTIYSDTGIWREYLVMIPKPWYIKIQLVNAVSRRLDYQIWRR